MLEKKCFVKPLYYALAYRQSELNEVLLVLRMSRAMPTTERLRSTPLKVLLQIGKQW